VVRVDFKLLLSVRFTRPHVSAVDICHSGVYVIVRPQSTVEYTIVTSVSTVDSGLTNLIHDRCGSDVDWSCLTAEWVTTR